MIHTGEFIKFKGKNPEHYNLDPNKIYVVQGYGKSYDLKLFNAKGKLRCYPESLFELVKIGDSEDPETKELKNRWLYDKVSPEDSRIAYELLKDKHKAWIEHLPFKKGSKVKFIKTKLAGRYENRVFVCNSDASKDGFLNASIRLVGLYGTYDVKDLEIVE